MQQHSNSQSQSSGHDKKIKNLLYAHFLVLVLSLSVIALMFYFYVLNDPQAPTFQQAQGTLSAEPSVTRSGTMITVEWSLQKQYEKNEILVQSRSELSEYTIRSSKKEDIVTSGAAASVAVENATGKYIYSASFEVGSCPETQNTYCNYSKDTYRYQLISRTGTEGFVSRVYEINTGEEEK